MSFAAPRVSFRPNVPFERGRLFERNRRVTGQGLKQGPVCRVNSRASLNITEEHSAHALARTRGSPA
jgi:hypothetical protein